jgi:hypothetical protein
MMLETVSRFIVPATYSLLPGEMASKQATAMLLAIGLQESGFRHRYQIPVAHARGFWQFEEAGLHGVLHHPATAEHVSRFGLSLGYRTVTVGTLHPAIQHNDVLACGLARLLLWTLPDALPGPDDLEEGLRQYLSAWRPGKPRPEEWPGNYRRAWHLVRSDGTT